MKVKPQFPTQKMFDDIGLGIRILVHAVALAKAKGKRHKANEVYRKMRDSLAEATLDKDLLRLQNLTWEAAEEVIVLALEAMLTELQEGGVS